MNKVLISVVGPTAIGKTRLGIILANFFQTEIISADSRQFYREMSIGTAIPTKEELAYAPHHFIQHKSIFEPYTVGDFEKDAILKLDTLFQEKDVVIMVGGSGLYTDAVTKGLDNFPKVSYSIRHNLNEEYTEKGIEVLQEKLKMLDPHYYLTVDTQNPHRLIRALEICIGTEKPYSSFLRQPKTKRDFIVFTVGIHAERPIIYERINKRVDIMMQEGLLEEVQGLHKHKALNALQTVGYKELFEYLDGQWTLEFAVSEIKKNTRRFAKRQNTWFKRNQETFWVDYDYRKDQILPLLNNKVLELQNE